MLIPIYGDLKRPNDKQHVMKYIWFICAGHTGRQGNPGPPGIGFPGPAGSTGFTGPTGPRGFTGELRSLLINDYTLYMCVCG